MDSKNTVKLKVNNNLFYNHWESVSITSEMNTLARSFTLQVTALLPNSISVLNKLETGDLVQVYIGNDLVLTGYIDKTPISYDATSVTATISGRSRTEDLIDCCPAPAGLKIESLVSATSNKWSSAYKDEDNVVEVNEKEVTARSWNKVPLKKIIAKLIAPYSIQLIDESGDSTLNRETTHTVKPTETILKALSNLVLSDDIWFIDNEKGNLVIVKKGSNEAVDTLQLTKNVLSASADFDSTQRFSNYEMIGTASGNNQSFGAKCNINGCEVDTEILRYRYLCTENKNQANTSVNKKGISGEALYRSSQYQKVTYTVQGWRQSNGELWKVNTIVSVIDNILFDTREAKMLIQKVTYNLNDHGMTTVLEVVPKDGLVKTNTSTASTSNKTTGSTNSSKNLWANITPIPQNSQKV